MSWSFTVTSLVGSEDALQQFKKRLEDNAEYIAPRTRDLLASAAALLVADAKEGYTVYLSCDGHTNSDGTWYGGVHVNGHAKPVIELPPEHSDPFADDVVVIAGGKPSDASLDESTQAVDPCIDEEALRDHDPKPGDAEYVGYMRDEADAQAQGDRA